MAGDVVFSQGVLTGQDGRPLRKPGPGDPRIPPPAEDLVNVETGLPALIVPESTSSARQENDLAKIGIYASKTDDFVVSVLDEDNDPLESVRFSAKDIANKVKPLLEACGHKVVDYTSGDLSEALGGGKVTPIRRKREAEASNS